jgi:hypothetical protein
MHDNIRLSPEAPAFGDFAIESGLASRRYSYSVYWLFQAGRSLCIETELHGFTSVNDAGFTAQQNTPSLRWSGERLLMDISPQHVPMVIQSGQYTVSRLADADRLHLYKHVRLTMPLPALHHRMADQSFTFIRAFCGPAGEFHA